ncbi:uncharacterized protein LTR77_000783 [Saxophila tyrrhenica]|uniref:Xylanolytic transcriptional activator regulatory domain-containing protein n=1 Tax=Saxophila tyrrhenica TaxID=1690608 RepID=A0AAV9PRJ2_9PEZI|nr:hypothetical protein LTR77_000783 [Saxophila tyrrhenica]
MPVENAQTTGPTYVQANLPTPFPSGPLSYDGEFWDPGILSASNWLDNVVDLDFQGVSPQFDFYGISPHNWNPGLSGQAPNEPVSNHMQHSAISPVAVASTVSGQSGHSESAADVCAAQEESEVRQGEYYVDGEPARLPRTKRRRLSSRLPARTNQQQSQATFSLQSPSSDSFENKHRVAISSRTYEQILKAWRSVCLTSLSPWPAFEASDPPTKELFEHLLGLYFVSFQPTLPFVHVASFNPETTNWILILAMTSVGAQYLEADGTSTLANSLHEFCRRCLFYQKEVQDWSPMDVFQLSQSRLLNYIGLTYSGDTRLHKAGLEMQHILRSSFDEVADSLKQKAGPVSDESETGWLEWSQREAIRRVSFSLFLILSMAAYHFQRRPLIQLTECELTLPSHEKPWNATTCADWQAAVRQHSPAPTLGQALQELYIEKRIPRDRGEFARIIMIHGLFHRTWDVSRYFSNPLSQWEPTAKKQTSSEVLPTSPVWTPGITTYNRWQNSVCDCMDVLHWQANATIGQAQGLEHPTVGFLHLSRVVLLSPIDSIVRFAEAVANRSDVTAVSKDKEFIQRWAVQGQYKARLAAIHAGTVFWHIRRYSTDGFYEATAVALATLMLWAFGTFSSKQTSGQQTAPRSQEQQITADAGEKGPETTDDGSDDTVCGIILLDRPTDDELVQQFIRKGHTMRANISGVGDLYGPRGPERVLQEGCKLLGSLKCWGTSDLWLGLLQRLGRTSKK